MGFMQSIKSQCSIWMRNVFDCVIKSKNAFTKHNKRRACLSTTVLLFNRYNLHNSFTFTVVNIEINKWLIPLQARTSLVSVLSLSPIAWEISVLKRPLQDFLSRITSKSLCSWNNYVILDLLAIYLAIAQHVLFFSDVSLCGGSSYVQKRCWWQGNLCCVF